MASAPTTAASGSWVVRTTDPCGNDDAHTRECTTFDEAVSDVVPTAKNREAEPREAPELFVQRQQVGEGFARVMEIRAGVDDGNG